MKFSIRGLAALDQIVAILTGPPGSERDFAYQEARASLMKHAASSPDRTILKIYQALQLQAEQEANEPPQPPAPGD